MKLVRDKSLNHVATLSQKKYLSLHYTHTLKRLLPNNWFEVVLESMLDTFNANSLQPDVVVYDRGLNPRFAIEFCCKEDLLEMKLAASTALEHYALEEFFLFDYESSEWHRLKRCESSFILNSWSELFALDLDALAPVAIF